MMRQPTELERMPAGSIECCEPYPVVVPILSRISIAMSWSPPNMCLARPIWLKI